MHSFLSRPHKPQNSRRSTWHTHDAFDAVALLRGRYGRSTHSRLRFCLCFSILTTPADPITIPLRLPPTCQGGLRWWRVCLSRLTSSLPLSSFFSLFGLFSVCLQSYFGNLSIYVRLLHGHARVAGVLF